MRDREARGASGRTGYRVTVHVQAAPELSLADAHSLGGRVKHAMSHAGLRIDSVLVHMEPYHGEVESDALRRAASDRMPPSRAQSWDPTLRWSLPPQFSRGGAEIRGGRRTAFRVDLLASSAPILSIHNPKMFLMVRWIDPRRAPRLRGPRRSNRLMAVRPRLRVKNTLRTKLTRASAPGSFNPPLRAPSKVRTYTITLPTPTMRHSRLALTYFVAVTPARTARMRGALHRSVA